jgi:hypothetical protein
MEWKRFNDVKPPRKIRLLVGLNYMEAWNYCVCVYFGGKGRNARLIKCGGSWDEIDVVANDVYWVRPITPKTKGKI